MIPKAFIELVLNKTDIGDLAGSYVELLPHGQSMAGPCPFHEGSGSTFTVSPEKQIWKCFKCGKGGNAIALVMELEKLNFPQAVAFLAKRLDLSLPNPDG